MELAEPWINRIWIVSGIGQLSKTAAQLREREIGRLLHFSWLMDS